MKTFKFTTEIFLFDAFVSVAYLLIVTIEYIKNSFVTRENLVLLFLIEHTLVMKRKKQTLNGVGEDSKQAW